MSEPRRYRRVKSSASEIYAEAEFISARQIKLTGAPMRLAVWGEKASSFGVSFGYFSARAEK
ncbi:hypothetical protein [Sporobacter termitidis]|uniref:hypothetical protein n=1 Tax=Sporobacter termitidis TaxID=44749 RepID=UPI001160D65F|nr:hypothetical protein [Sporobacter termitidis]